VDGLGWEWIFFVNVPVGVLAFVLAFVRVPALETHPHRFDWLGVALSAVGMFCLVFGIQEGRSYDWGHLWGPFSVPGLIALGLVVIVAFVVWQWRQRGEPLVPLGIFRDRNFSLANAAMTTIGFAITSMAFPLMLWAQGVRGWSPTQSACLLIPMAVISAALAPFVGRLADRMHPRILAGIGMVSFAVSLAWLGLWLTPDAPVWRILLPIALLGVANGFMWSPISTTATRNLPLHQAGAGAGVYNTMRQVGSVLGSASIAVLMESRIASHLGGGGAAPGEGMPTGTIPPAVADGFSRAMGESLYLPAAVVVVGLVAALLFERPRHFAAGRD
jgi:MFS family permease